MIFNLVWLPARQTGSSTRTKVLLRIMLRDTTVCEDDLVKQALILTPRDVSLVMAEDQHLPVLPLAPDAMDDLLAALNQLNPAAGPAERVGPAVDGIGQQVMDSGDGQCCR